VWATVVVRATPEEPKQEEEPVPVWVQSPVSQFAPSTTLTQHLGMTDAKHQYQTDAVGVGRTAGRGVGVDTRVNDGTCFIAV
jgi:hypothetical protein